MGGIPVKEGRPTQKEDRTRPTVGKDVARSSEFPAPMPHLVCLVTNRLDCSWQMLEQGCSVLYLSFHLQLRTSTLGAIRSWVSKVELLLCAAHKKGQSYQRQFLSGLLVLGEEFEAQQI